MFEVGISPGQTYYPQGRHCKMLSLHDIIVNFSVVHLLCNVTQNSLMHTKGLTIATDAVHTLLLYDSVINNTEEIGMLRTCKSSRFKLTYIVYRLGSIASSTADVICEYSFQR